MVKLSVEQIKEYVLPLVKNSMLPEVAYPLEEDGDRDLWGLFDRDKLIVVCGLGCETKSTEVCLSFFAVDSEYRRKGLGTYALEYVEEIAKERGYKTILVETYDNPVFETAIKLYKKLGYVEVGYILDYLDDDSDMLYLRKVL